MIQDKICPKCSYRMVKPFRRYCPNCHYDYKIGEEDRLKNLLDIFSNEINKIKLAHNDLRVFKLLKKGEEGNLYDFHNLSKENNSYCFLCIYDPQLIEVYYDLEGIKVSYINDVNFSPEDLENIFKYFAHHEYGHTQFYHSPTKLRLFWEKKIKFWEKELKNPNLKMIIHAHISRTLKESFAVENARHLSSTLPIYYFYKHFKYIENIINVRNAITVANLKVKLKIPNPNFQPNALVTWFLESVFFNSIPFYSLNKWDYLLEKGANIKISNSIDLMLCIHKALKRIRKKIIDLNIYWERLLRLAGLLEKIDYYNLILNDNLDENSLNLIENLGEFKI